jgi:hypothetical protein
LNQLKKKSQYVMKSLRTRSNLLLHSDALVVVTAIPIIYLACAIAVIKVNRTTE